MFWEVHPDGAQWSLRRTTFGRVVAALDWAWRGFVGTAVVGAVFFGIDYYGRIAIGAETPGAYLLTVLSFAVFGAFFAFVARLLRFRHWVIDREARTLGLSIRRVFADPQVDEVGFDELSRIRLRTRGFGSRSEIIAEFTDGAVDVLATTRAGGAGFDGIEVGLKRAFDDTGVTLEVEE